MLLKENTYISRCFHPNSLFFVYVSIYFFVYLMVLLNVDINLLHNILFNSNAMQKRKVKKNENLVKYLFS